MNQEELKTLVAQMLRELAPQPEPQVKGSEYRPTVLEPQPARQPEDPGQLLPDISEIDLREQYLVEHPANGPAYRPTNRWSSSYSQSPVSGNTAR